MTHRNAPLTAAGRQRAVDQVIRKRRPSRVRKGVPPAILPYERQGDLQHVPRLSSRVLRRPSHLELWDGPGALVLVHTPGGTCKTTLLAQ